jgi:hypothetical protein
MTMREKIARIMISGNSPELWESLAPESKHFWLERADAVFDALAEPTEGMANAGANSIRRFNPDYDRDYDAAADLFKAMITAAKEGK